MRGPIRGRETGVRALLFSIQIPIRIVLFHRKNQYSVLIFVDEFSRLPNEEVSASQQTDLRNTK